LIPATSSLSEADLGVKCVLVADGLCSEASMALPHEKSESLPESFAASLSPKGVEPRLVVNVSGPGTIVSTDGHLTCPGTCVRDYFDTKAVELHALAGEGATFIGWDYSGCPPTNDRCVILLKSEETVTVRARFEPRRSQSSPRIIFVGICGAGAWGNECVEDEGWFDPRDSQLFKGFNPLNPGDLENIAETSSGIIAVGYRIGAEFQNSLVTIASFSAQNVFVPGVLRAGVVVENQIRPFYRAGDKVVLIGHSLGGAVVSDIIKELEKLMIPVEFAAWIDAVGVEKIEILGNVKYAYNVFYRKSFLDLCEFTGASKVEIRDKTESVVFSFSIRDPQGPDGGVCRPHRNMDNDERVWSRIMKQMMGVFANGLAFPNNAGVVTR
jgi:hypothetical protein